MADPFSIAIGAVGIIDVTSRFVQYMVARGAAAANVLEERKVILDDCRHTLERLEKVVKEIIRDT